MAGAARSPLPPYACWRHRDVREGFEAVFFGERPGGGWHIEGHTAAFEDEPFAVRYAIDVDDAWRTRSVHVHGRSLGGAMTVTLESDGAGAWLVDGDPAEHLAECLDVDLESSAFTNALPVHRLGLEPGEEADVPAVYVRATSLEVARLEQRYRRIDDDPEDRPRYEYEAPAFDFRCVLTYDRAGLVLDYPGLAFRSDP